MIKIVNEVDFSRFDDDYLGKEWVVTVAKECIKDATLLSWEEYEKYKNVIPEMNDLWWLRTVGNRRSVLCAYNTSEDVYPYFVNCTRNGIRPALILKAQSSKLNTGDKFEFGNHMFTIISSGLAICDDFICKGCFRGDREAPDTTVYEKSDVKKIVDNWFNESYRNYK